MEGLALGADDYIVKPFDGPDLLARVAKVLQRVREARDESPLSGLPGHARVIQTDRGLLTAANEVEVFQSVRFATGQCLEIGTHASFS